MQYWHLSPEYSTVTLSVRSFVSVIDDVGSMQPPQPRTSDHSKSTISSALAVLNIAIRATIRVKIFFID